MKKKILLTAGGTATTWHFCQIIKEYFDDKYEIHITDINEKYLVPAAIYAYKYYKVPSIYENNYEEVMYNIIKKEKIDIIVPLIDFDLKTFSKDNKKLKELNVITTAPLLNTTETLSNKLNMYKYLNKNNIPTPECYELHEINLEKEYVIKPLKGFGSNGVKIIKGKDIENIYNENILIQEKCQPTEITAEIFNGDTIRIFQRERIATKAGVCTKMIPVNYDQINNEIINLVNIIECPKAFCIQFMQNEKGDWCIVDCNLRIGAGTALSTKAGFQLVRALLSYLIEEEVKEEYFEVDKEIKSVLRVFEEVIIK